MRTWASIYWVIVAVIKFKLFKQTVHHKQVGGRPVFQNALGIRAVCNDLNRLCGDYNLADPWWSKSSAVYEYKGVVGRSPL